MERTGQRQKGAGPVALVRADDVALGVQRDDALVVASRAGCRSMRGELRKAGAEEIGQRAGALATGREVRAADLVGRVVNGQDLVSASGLSQRGPLLPDGRLREPRPLQCHHRQPPRTVALEQFAHDVEEALQSLDTGFTEVDHPGEHEVLPARDGDADLAGTDAEAETQRAPGGSDWGGHTRA